MDAYDQSRALLLGLPAVQAWPALQAAIHRATLKHNRHWRVPLVAAEAVGGAEPAVHALAAIACLHTSIILVDDMLDADPRGEYRHLGQPVAANLALAFQALGLAVLAEAPASCAARLAAQQSFSQAALAIACGQDLDTQNPADEAGYWRVVQAKSAPFFGAALHLGALLVGASAGVAAQLRQLGLLYGEMIQVYDDVNDTLAEPLNPDWALGRAPLPILFAQTVNHPERERFLALRAQLRAAPNSEALQAAQAIVVRCGGLSYSVHALLQRQAAAGALLAACPLPNRSVLNDLLEDAIRPVRRLLAAVGAAA
jgi:geranylgeranyl pyrophosphate synthase